MARVIRKENNLLKLYEEYKNKAKKLFIAGGILIVSSYVSFPLFFLTFGLSAFLTMLLFTSGGVCVLLGAYNLNKANTYKSGLEGEATSDGVLSNLPDDYYIFYSIDIKYQGEKSQIDHLVVGPTGVFIIESRNVKGYIVGRDDDKEITVHKVGQKGGQYTVKMYNPIKQVTTHVYRASSYLKEQGINTWVQGIVYFTNPASTVCLESSKIPVFSESEDGGREIYNYILNYENNNPLDENKIKLIVKAIEENLNQNNGFQYNNSYATNFDILNNSFNNFMEEEIQRQAYNMHRQIIEQQIMQQQAMHQQAVELQMMQEQEIQRQLFEQQMVNEAMKSAMPFDHGGYVQGPGFNPSDTIAHDNMMNHMF